MSKIIGIDLGTMRLDVACLSTKAVRPDEGTFESNIGLLRIKQIVANNSAKVVLMADHTKFGDSSLCKVLDMSRINVLITDVVDIQNAVGIDIKGDFNLRRATRRRGQAA